MPEQVRYELRAVGVYDRVLQKHLTTRDPEFHREYHEWLAAGGVPAPEKE